LTEVGAGGGGSFSGTAGYALNAGLLNSQNSAYYLNRTNHTGTQPTSTISDLNAKILTNVFLRC